MHSVCVNNAVSFMDVAREQLQNLKQQQILSNRKHYTGLVKLPP